MSEAVFNNDVAEQTTGEDSIKEVLTTQKQCRHGDRESEGVYESHFPGY
jgi:hypothetical protein